MTSFFEKTPNPDQAECQVALDRYVLESKHLSALIRENGRVVDAAPELPNGDLIAAIERIEPWIAGLRVIATLRPVANTAPTPSAVKPAQAPATPKPAATTAPTGTQAPTPTPAAKPVRKTLTQLCLEARAAGRK